MTGASGSGHGGAGTGPGMGRRGATRPEMERHGDQMSPADRERLMARHHRETLWVHWLVLLLGLWMMVAPFTFSYRVGTVEPAGRTVWLPLEARATAMTISDVLSGLALVILGWRALSPARPLARWGACAVGIWLTTAPIIFWCPTAVGYLNDTLVGALVIALTVLIPGMPAMLRHMKMGGAVPPGWTYNPSSWPQRWIMIATGFAGWMVSRYLAAYQLGYIPQVADPFFGDATRAVLESRVSHAWPISDAGLGSLAYTFEFLMGFMGSPARWRTMPWMVTFFGILVIPLGLVHIVLVILQPVVVGHWCTLCLVAAGIMLPMIPLELDEVIAMVQFLRRAVARGERFWHVFWLGGADPDAGPDERTPPLERLPARPGGVLAASVWGLSVPWSLAGSLVLGALAMALPALAGSTGAAADAERLAGALIVTVSGIALGEVARTGRFLNVLLGLVLIGAATANDRMPARIADVAIGAAVIALAWPRGPVREHYGTWDAWVR